MAQAFAIIIFLAMFILIIMDKWPKQYVTLGCALLTLILVFGVGMHSMDAVIETLNVKSIFTQGFWYTGGQASETSSGINWETIVFLAGMMIIPSIFVFSGTEGMAAGPGLMFVALPKTFAAMGVAGHFVGGAFFLMAVFATLTSCISVLEAITANCMEITGKSRPKVTGVLTVLYTAASIIIALGYSLLYVEVQLPNGSTGQLLDIMDYISNSFMMPFISLLSTILIGWVLKPEWISDEIEQDGIKMRRKTLYRVMVKYVCPIIMLILFLQSTGLLGMVLK